MSYRVALGYHNWGMVHARFMSSVCRALVYEGRKVSEIIDIPSPYVAEGRNKIVWAFLEKTQASHLLMMDADIEFPDDAISTMGWIARANGLPLLGANYALGDFGNSIFAGTAGSELVRPLLKIQPNTLYRNCGGVATGFLLLERSMLEHMRKEFEGPWYWFDHDRESVTKAYKTEEESGFHACGFTKMGEDMSFCRRAAKLGYEIAGTTHVPLIHHKYRACVPQDQLEQFKGQKVYSSENPWIQEFAKAGIKVPLMAGLDAAKELEEEKKA